MSMYTFLENLVNKLPYENSKAVKESINALLNTVKSLNPSTGTLINNIGVESRLVLLSGTIPIVFQRVQYNIPVDIFIPLGFPQKAPIVYVRPTPEMVVSPHHSNVDSDGFVRISYLEMWRISSTLTEMVRSLQSIFGEKPPLYAKPPQTSQQASIRGTAVNSFPYTAGEYSTSTNNVRNSGSSQVAMGTVVEEKSQESKRSVMEANRMKPTVSQKQELIDQVTSKLQQELHDCYSKITNDLDAEFAIEAKLTASATLAKLQLKELQQSKVSLQDAIHEVECQKTKLESTRSEMQAENPFPVDDALASYDDLTNQIARTTAEYMTVDDALYYLNKALTSEVRKSDLHMFMKETRKLARLQFLAKVHLIKIQNSSRPLS